MRLLVGLAMLALVATPAWANLLSDSEGGFEDPWPSQPNAWSANMERDSTIWGPGPACGQHYGSVQTGGPTGRDACITSIYVPPSTTVTLTGMVAGGTNNAAADIYIQLIDGSSSNDVVVDEWRYDFEGATTTGLAWTPFSLSGHINQDGHVKILVGLEIKSGWSNGTAIHVDCLDLTPEPASLALFALAGLPLLRRRR